MGFLSVSVVKNLPVTQDMHETPGFDPWVGKIPWRRAWQPSCILSWRNPWTEEPGRLQSIGLQRVGHDWSYWALSHKQTLVLSRYVWASDSLDDWPSSSNELGCIFTFKLIKIIIRLIIFIDMIWNFNFSILNKDSLDYNNAYAFTNSL